MDAVSQSPIVPVTPISARQQSALLKSTPSIEKMTPMEVVSTPVPPPTPVTPSVPVTPAPIPASVPTTPSVGGEDSNDASQPPQTLTPRQSGSMVTHHDDVVTRMKNIEMIELGEHRIKPWYFAPYPQVHY